MIVVTTPTGQIGGQVVEHLLDGDEAVRVVVRDPARLDPQVRERVEVVEGSHDDAGVVAAAFDGADAVLWVVPPDPRAEDVEGHYLAFTRPMCEAVASRGVQHVVGVTSLGRGWPRDAGNLSAAFAMDDLIEATGVHYRALAMPFFLENLLHQVDAITGAGMIAMPNAAERPLAAVATRDIAPAAVRLLADRSWTGQRSAPVVGPDDLTPTAMAQVVSDVLDRPVRYQQVPADAYRATMVSYGTTDAWARGLVAMAAAQDEGIYDAEAASAQRAPTGLRRWCEEVLAPAVRARSGSPAA